MMLAGLPLCFMAGTGCVATAVVVPLTVTADPARSKKPTGVLRVGVNGSFLVHVELDIIEI